MTETETRQEEQPSLPYSEHHAAPTRRELRKAKREEAHRRREYQPRHQFVPPSHQP